MLATLFFAPLCVFFFLIKDEEQFRQAKHEMNDIVDILRGNDTAAVNSGNEAQRGNSGSPGDSPPDKSEAGDIGGGTDSPSTDTADGTQSGASEAGQDDGGEPEPSPSQASEDGDSTDDGGRLAEDSGDSSPGTGAGQRGFDENEPGVVVQRVSGEEITPISDEEWARIQNLEGMTPEEAFPVFTDKDDLIPPTFDPREEWNGSKKRPIVFEYTSKVDGQLGGFVLVYVGNDVPEGHNFAVEQIRVNVDQTGGVRDNRLWVIVRLHRREADPPLDIKPEHMLLRFFPKPEPGAPQRAEQ